MAPRSSASPRPADGVRTDAANVNAAGADAFTRPPPGDPDGPLEWPHQTGVDPWNLFLKSYKTVIGLIDRDLKAATGLNLSQYEIIIQIEIFGGRARLVDIARKTLLSKSRITRQIDTLQHKGLLYRETLEAQPRATYAVLTDEGRRMFDAALQPFLRTYYRHFLDLLDDQDVNDFARVTRKLVEQGKPKRGSKKAELKV